MPRIGKQKRIGEPRVTRDDEIEIRESVLYGYEATIDSLIRRLAKRQVLELDGDTYWTEQRVRSWYLAYVGRLQRQHPYHANNRCPTCGVKLAVRRCLGCDLRRQK